MNTMAEREVSDSVPEKSFGELMECLLRDRERFGSDEEFRSYAIGAFRRFITDLRRIVFEISLRPNLYVRQRTPG